MLGSIKTIYLILYSIATSTTLTQLINEADDYNYFKFRLEIRNFLMEIMDYLRSQITEMNTFLLAQTTHTQTKQQGENTARTSAENDNENSDDQNHNQNDATTKSQRKSENTSKKVKLDEADNANSASPGKNNPVKSTLTTNATNTSANTPPMLNVNKAAQMSPQNPTRLHVMRQVDLKRKYLEHIIQVLVQTINFLSTSIAISPFAASSASSNNSSSSDSDSSSASSTSSSSSSSSSQTQTSSSTSSSPSSKDSVSSSPSHESQPPVKPAIQD